MDDDTRFAILIQMLEAIRLALLALTSAQANYTTDVLNYVRQSQDEAALAAASLYGKKK